MVTAARRFPHRPALFILHVFDDDVAVAFGSDDFNFVADTEFVFDRDLGQAGSLIVGQDFAAKLLPVAFRIADDVVLIVVAVMALIESVGVTAIRQIFQHADQFRLKRPAGAGVIDGLPIALRGPGDIIMRFGAAFDFQTVDADFDQPLNMLDGA